MHTTLPFSKYKPHKLASGTDNFVNPAVKSFGYSTSLTNNNSQIRELGNQLQGLIINMAVHLLSYMTATSLAHNFLV